MKTSVQQISFYAVMWTPVVCYIRSRDNQLHCNHQQRA